MFVNNTIQGACIKKWTILKLLKKYKSLKMSHRLVLVYVSIFLSFNIFRSRTLINVRKANREFNLEKRESLLRKQVSLITITLKWFACSY